MFEPDLFEEQCNIYCTNNLECNIHMTKLSQSLFSKEMKVTLTDGNTVSYNTGGNDAHSDWNKFSVALILILALLWPQTCHR